MSRGLLNDPYAYGTPEAYGALAAYGFRQPFWGPPYPLEIDSYAFMGSNTVTVRKRPWAYWLRRVRRKCERLKRARRQNKKK